MDLINFIKGFNKKTSKPVTPQELKLLTSLMRNSIVLKRYDKRSKTKQRRTHDLS